MPFKKLANRYLITSEIGRGALATVWRATDEVLSRTVAVKILHPRLSVDDSFRERFRLEALGAAKLVHPNILSIYDTGEVDNLLFVVMEHASANLRSLLDGRAFDTEGGRAVARLGASLCSALAYAHSLGAVHSDIKPSNILFPEVSVTKLGDFGLGRATAQSASTIATSKMTTVQYLSPEQVSGQPIDPRSDIYSLGCVLYEILCGTPPFQGSDLAAATARLKTDPTPIGRSNPEVPRALADAVMRALERDPTERFSDAEEMRGGLAELTDTYERSTVNAPLDRSAYKQARASPSSPAVPASFVRSEGRWLAVAVLVILAASGLVFGVVRYGEKVVSSVRQTLSGSDAGVRGEQIAIQQAFAYDPDGDNNENNDEAGNVKDGNEKTVWKTQRYRDASFGRLKEGVGIYFDIGQARELGHIEIVTTTPGWEATIRYSDNPQEWSQPGPSSRVVGRRHEFTTKGKHRYWMVWITNLASTGEDPANRFSASIAEISAYAS